MDDNDDIEWLKREEEQNDDDDAINCSTGNNSTTLRAPSSEQTRRVKETVVDDAESINCNAITFIGP
jgi:hypothetical protein